MSRQLLVGFALSTCNIVVHALVMAAVVRVMHIAVARYIPRPMPHLIAVMVATVSVSTVAYALEVAVWSLAYAIVDAAPRGGHPVYLALVNCKPWMYGVVLPVERWRRIGPIKAMKGMLRLVDRHYFRGGARRMMTGSTPIAAAR